jgi:outer membrane biosynthesis protein TonB
LPIAVGALFVRSLAQLHSPPPPPPFPPPPPPGADPLSFLWPKEEATPEPAKPEPPTPETKKPPREKKKAEKKPAEKKPRPPLELTYVPGLKGDGIPRLRILAPGYSRNWDGVRRVQVDNSEPFSLHSSHSSAITATTCLPGTGNTRRSTSTGRNQGPGRCGPRAELPYRLRSAARPDRDAP